MMAKGPLKRNERIVLEHISKAADRGALCPTNGELAEALGRASTAIASNAVKSLEKRGLIEVERFTMGRTVTVIATGRSTKAPLNTRPHRPRGPGSPKPVRKPVPRPDTLSIPPRIEVKPGRYVLDADGRLHPFKHKAFVGAVVAVTVRAKPQPESVPAPVPTPVAAPVSAPPPAPPKPRPRRVLREEPAPPKSPVHHGGVVVIEPEREIDWSRAAEAHRALLTKSAPAKPKTALLCGICKEPHESVRKAEAACTYCRAVESAL